MVALSPGTEHDEQEGYCRLLGHHLRFAYCRVCREGGPCHKILDCWFERFDVGAFVEAHYPKAEIDRFLEPPKPKMATLLSLIAQARKAHPST